MQSLSNVIVSRPHIFRNIEHRIRGLGGDGESQKQQQCIRSGHSRALANVRMLYADHLSLASPLESVISLHYPPVINLQNGLIL